MATPNSLDARELATVLAALRCWQDAITADRIWNARQLQDIATDSGESEALTVDEIDTLAERLNCGGS